MQQEAAPQVGGRPVSAEEEQSPTCTAKCGAQPVPPEGSHPGPFQSHPPRQWSDVTLEELRGRLAEFALERDWDQYHTPRNLILALVGETGELCELFQWRPEAEAGRGLPGFSDQERQAVEEELADVLLYLLRLSDMCGVDLGRAALSKILKNAAKYPAAKCHGSSAKYTAYVREQGQRQQESCPQEVHEQ
ncbi:hypothetical protein Vretimale_12258 [Volvox reticuliferus]|uniref:dCTP pyrophosphatase 1 n=1 Tax=Volvox reticuliferus TaxID=1737510 RepID=A0A8J4FK47_9CHLO|nr:hypothetical protein Vretifemale_8969 [Volvox reticuliferus]GIM08284.1 hypothetical protein Vretimale_12258 [Volvox reticuliferus]